MSTRTTEPDSVGEGGLEEVGRLLAAEGPTATVLDAIMAVLTRQHGYRHVSLHLLGEDGVARLAAQRGYSVSVDFDGTRGVIGRVMRTREPAFVPDVRRDPDYTSANPAVTGEICVPLLAHGELLGILNVESTIDRPLDTADRGLVAIVGDRLAAALALAHERGKLGERVAVFQRLVGFSARINAMLDETELYRAVVEAVAMVVPADLVGLTVLDRASSRYLVRAAKGADRAVGKEIRTGEGMAGRAIRDRVLIRATDFNSVDQPVAVRDVSAAHYGVALGVPVIREGIAIGALTLGRVASDRPFTSLELEALELVANQTALALGNSFLHSDLAELAIHDGLTGLPNRAFVMARLESELKRAKRARGRRTTAVLFLDLDEFKLINDSFGHPSGDAVLIAVARRLEAGLREGDTVARLGGDEFIIVLTELPNPAAAEIAAQRVLELLATPLELADRRVTVSTSVGIATADPGKTTPDELIAQADMAMYAAKAAGRGRYEFFAPKMRTESRRRLEFAHELAGALAAGELRVHYQPILELATMRMIGVEALVRWERPGHGLVPPGDFIPVAEATGLINGVGEYVLETACRDVLGWQHLPAAAGLSLSVNVSARQFTPGFAADVHRTLSSTGFDPRQLKLEITESAVLEDAYAAEAAMAELRGLGVQFVVDDFGTGYSALGYFKRFGIAGLKLDRSFVSGLGRGREDTAIVVAAIAFARALGVTVTAEGIEDPQQLHWLRAAGCELGQGYFLSRPLPAESIGGLLVEMAPTAGRRAGANTQIRAARVLDRQGGAAISR
jgi:diguanylate cyclase (GGDEF)-like protein